MKHKINEANIRERILSDDYGKFDLIETIYPQEEIINSLPRVLLKNIMTRFSIPHGAINRKTFWSWHLRYKKKHRVHGSTSASFFQSENNSLKIVSEQPGDWRDFNPSKADSSKLNKPIIKIIK